MTRKGNAEKEDTILWVSTKICSYSKNDDPEEIAEQIVEKIKSDGLNKNTEISNDWHLMKNIQIKN